MPLIDYTLFGKVNKVEQAIERIRAFDPIINGTFEEPFYVAYSGGKDSDVIRILCDLAGVQYDLVHNHTTADAPETVRYIHTIPGIQFNMPSTSHVAAHRKEGHPTHPHDAVLLWAFERTRRHWPLRGDWRSLGREPTAQNIARKCGGTGKAEAKEPDTQC